MVRFELLLPLYYEYFSGRLFYQGIEGRFLHAHRTRITVNRLPSYAPDDHPIAYLWKKTKKRGTHNKYFKEFAALTGSVEEALAYFATHPEEVLCLFGRYCKKSKLDLQQAA